MAEWNARSLEGEPREELKAFLASLQSQNLGLSTSIVDAMLAYEMVESPVSAETVVGELTKILRSPEDPKARESAYHAVANCFEEVYQGAFEDAIEALSRNDRVRLLTMAALGAPGYGSFTNWTLKELLRLGDKRALPAFQHWTTTIDTKSCDPQETAARYALGVMGCAQYLVEPPPLVQPQNDVEWVWQAYGAILFWLYKPGLSSQERQTAAALWWQRLQTDLPFDAVDPLMRLEQVTQVSSQEIRRVIDDLCSEFTDQVRHLLEFGLKNRTRLTGLFGRFPLREETALFIIRWLGIVGDRGTVRLLEPLVDTPDLGPYAVEAVRKLKAPNPTV